MKQIIQSFKTGQLTVGDPFPGVVLTYALEGELPRRIVLNGHTAVETTAIRLLGR